MVEAVAIFLYLKLNDRNTIPTKYTNIPTMNV